MPASPRDGRGIRVEVHPLNHLQVSQPRQCPVEFWHLNVRDWDRIVVAWAAGDDQELDDAWVDQVVDLGSLWGRYEYVTKPRNCFWQSLTVCRSKG
ncbi:hypothetical protein [Streptomyces sp. NPDC017991]|uniref:hypothetical protein n=1 Tax=Streptomyces sp. NPDC017991 TaxID=3365026 RepID=UPI0037B53183